MGFFHEGHLSLVRRARQENDKVGVSIFVNPAQFNDQSDLEKYPRDPEKDLDLLRKEQVDLVWTPSVDQVYPSNYQTFINVEKVTGYLEGTARPGHFRGVATVVAKLFNVFQPDRAYFGQKDAQQLVVIRQMVRDLNFNIEVIGCPTIRDTDGLAMSSRNAGLSTEGREQAICLFEALKAGERSYKEGEREAKIVKGRMLSLIHSFEGARIDYVSVADPVTLQELDELGDAALISLAVFVDGVRLIDNILVETE